MTSLIEKMSDRELLKTISEHNQWELLDTGQQYSSSLYKLTSDIQDLQDKIITCKEVGHMAKAEWTKRKYQKSSYIPLLTKVSTHLKHIIKKYHVDMDDTDLYAIMSLEKEVSSVL